VIDINKIVIKTLIDNEAATPFVMAEWGLSIYLDIDGKKILFDTGAGNQQVLLHNMRVMGVKPSQIDLLVLSHGHQDHTGGLRYFFEEMHYEEPDKDLEIICHPAALTPEYVKSIGSFGCPFTEEELVRFGARFKLEKGPTWIDENIVISGEIPMINDYESVGQAFYREAGSEYVNNTDIITDEKILGFKTDGKKFVQDEEFMDDQAIFIKTDQGLIVILGCAHKGTINTIHYAQKITNMDKVYMVIGGTHTAGVSEYRMNSTIAEMKSLNINKVGVSHCTGLVSACILSSGLGRDIFFHNNAGSIISFSNNQISVNEF
jgi:7,8-dihydropterin-6-yl-methyl-4-(beta-D-ribofuranosyl)aminobenzene 5'-phosphate synthase